MTVGTSDQEVVATKTVSRKRKWLRRFGTFLMMGGWLLMLFLVLAIVILVSILAQ